MALNLLNRHIRSPEAKPVKAAESSQVRALKGSVEHEGLAVENEILDNLILYQGPHLYPINAAPGIITEQPRLHPAFGRAILDHIFLLKLTFWKYFELAFRTSAEGYLGIL